MAEKGYRTRTPRAPKLQGLHLVDPLTYCYSPTTGRPALVACDLASECAGHETGKLTAVADGNEEVRHYATSERAAKRWLRVHRAQEGTVG